MSLIRSISTVGGLTMVSRVLGFCRDILMARYIGAGLAFDCFVVAFKLPNFFRRLFAEGAFSAAFVPLFAGLLGDHPGPGDERRARLFAEEALAILLPVLLLLVALVQTTAPWVMVVLAPGFVDQPDKFDLAVHLTRLTFPYLALISLVSLLAGILNGVNRFAAAAAAPILLNLCLISALVIFHQSPILTAEAVSATVTIAGVAQFLWLYRAAAAAGYPLRLRWPRLSPKIRRLGVIMLPVALGAGAYQVNLIIDIILASLLPEGSLSFLFYADRINQLPLGVVGIAVGTVLLPALSRSLASGHDARAQGDQNRAIEAALFLTVPAAVALAVIPSPVISTLFQHGEFTASDTAATATALMAYALGLPAYVLVKVLAPAFFAREDTATPVKVSVMALLANTILNIILMIPLKHVGLALATAIAAWINAGTLYVIMHRRGYFRLDARLKSRIWRILSASVGMGAALWALTLALAPAFSGDVLGRAIALAGLVGLGLAAYGALAHTIGAARLSEWRRILRRP